MPKMNNPMVSHWCVAGVWVGVFLIAVTPLKSVDEVEAAVAACMS